MQLDFLINFLTKRTSEEIALDSYVCTSNRLTPARTCYQVALGISRHESSKFSVSSSVQLAMEGWFNVGTDKNPKEWPAESPATLTGASSLR